MRIFSNTDHPFSLETDQCFPVKAIRCSPLKPITSRPAWFRGRIEVADSPSPACLEAFQVLVNVLNAPHNFARSAGSPVHCGIRKRATAISVLN
jgi:hypothetical protein